MIPMIRRLASILALASITFGAWVVDSAADPAGFAFLEVPAGARASALGGAYASRAEGVEAAFWNPAGLSDAKGIQVVGSHFEFFERLRHDQFAVAGRWKGVGIAAGLRAMYSEPIVERDEIGNEIGTFGGHDLEFSLAAGREVGAGVRAGVSSQIVRERIANSAATTYSFGAGTSWSPSNT